MTQKEPRKKCVSFIDENVKEKLSLDDIVNAVYFSKTHCRANRYISCNVITINIRERNLES